MRGQTAEAFLPAPNALSSLKSVTATLRGFVCRSSSPSFLLGLAVGGRVCLSPSTARPFAASGPRVRRHSCFSPAVYGTRAGQPSVQHFSLHHPEQGRRGLSFTVEGAAASRPSRHPISGMSSLTRHSASSIALLSRMGASTGGIAVGSPHNSVRLHTSVGKNPPRFDGVHLTVVNSASKASVLQQKLSSLLQKGAIEEVPQSDVEQGFFSRYFLIPKRDGGLRPILDLGRLNFSLYKGKFKMLTMKTIMSQVQGGDCFVTIDLKDAYFHIQVVQRHRRFLRFAFGGKAYQYKVLPFGLALASRTFTKCMDAALAPLRLQGIHVLNYLDDWLILAHSRELVNHHRDIVLGHIHSLGLRMNAKKSVLLPSQRTVFLGVRLDSVQMQARLAPAQLPDFTACLARFKLGHHVSVGTCRRLLGLSVAPRVASHEAVPLVDEGDKVTPHCTNNSPYQGVAQLLSTPFTVARPRFSPERGENGCDPPSPYDHDGRINDRLGRRSSKADRRAGSGRKRSSLGI